MTLPVTQTATPPASLPPLVRGGALDLLRFLAAACFVLYHYEQHAPVPFEQIHPALGRAYLGTDFFLILSGYVLGRAYGPRVAAGGVDAVSFLIKRVARVWPPYIVALGAMVAMASAAALLGQAANNPQGFDFAALPGHILLIQAWGLGFTQGWNTPTWTLSALVFCYALFPYLWPRIAKVPGAAVLAVGAGVIAAADLVARALGLHFYDSDQAVGIFRAVPLFTLGLVAARYVPPAALARRGWMIWPLTALLVFVIQALGRFDFATILVIGVTVMFAGAYTPKRPSDLVARAGQLAFALYLTHTLSGIIWYRVLEHVGPLQGAAGPAAWLVWASAFPFALVVAMIFHRLVELPLKAWSDRWIQRRRPAARASAV